MQLEFYNSSNLRVYPISKPTLLKTTGAAGLCLLLILSPACIIQAGAQAAPTVGFTLSPSVFTTGQSSSTLLCMSPSNTAGTLMFNQNDVIGFNFDNSIGTVTAVNSPLSVHSSTISATDF